MNQNDKSATKKKGRQKFYWYNGFICGMGTTVGVLLVSSLTDGKWYDPLIFIIFFFFCVSIAKVYNQLKENL